MKSILFHFTFHYQSYPMGIIVLIFANCLMQRNRDNSNTEPFKMHFSTLFRRLRLLQFFMMTFVSWLNRNAGCNATEQKKIVEKTEKQKRILFSYTHHNKLFGNWSIVYGNRCIARSTGMKWRKRKEFLF